MKTPGTWLAAVAVAVAAVAAVAVTWGAGCGSRQLPSKGGEDDGEDSGDDDGDVTRQREPAELARVMAVDWAFHEIVDPDGEDPPRTKVSIATTDETGATAVQPMGEFAGRCAEKAGGPGSLGKALLAASCPDDRGGGTELRLRRYGGHLILLRAPYGEADDLSFEEAGRIAVSPGLEVRAKQ